jgi:hypothetical protein
LAPFAIVAAAITVAAPPAHATSYCAGADVNPSTGVYVCTP